MEVDEEVNQNQNPTKISTENGTSSKKSKKKENKEGSFLLGSPTFTELGNGRFKCNETGHELPAKEKEPYGRSKTCRVALIDAAVAGKKPPLNTFQQCPLSKSKLVCELTGDTINKSEEHIWKHITGKRFQNKLEEKELEKMVSPERVEKNSKKSKKLHKSCMEALEEDQEIKPYGKGLLEGNDEERNSDIEEPDFWTPPVGERWDFDDEKDRWEDSMTPDHHDQEDGLDEGNEGDEQNEVESVELSMRTKRMSIAVGPNSFASRKKKIKKASSTHS